MSVYTVVTQEQLAEFLKDWPVGQLISFRGISGGITNTNYFVDTTRGPWVLTLFETLRLPEIPYFLRLKAFLSARGVACPAPVQRNDGAWAGMLCGKPAAMVSVLPGQEASSPNERQCFAIGRMLARLHEAGRDFPEHMPNPRGETWWREASTRLESVLPAEEAAWLNREIHAIARTNATDLPHGVIHADLFRDNVLFEGDEVGGIIDFYYACDGLWVYDLAICANDWCVNETGEMVDARWRALRAGYESVRALTLAEQHYWPTARRAAAVRFWVSRLLDFHFPQAGELTFIKDPNVFREILRRINDQCLV